MKLRLFFVFLLVLAPLARATSATIYAPRDYLEPAKQYLRQSKLTKDEFAIVLISLVDGQKPQVSVLKKWRTDELKDGVKFDASSGGILFVGNLQAIRSPQRDLGDIRVSGHVLLDIAAAPSSDGQWVDGSRVEARLDHPFAPRQIRLAGGEATRRDGVRTGTDLLFVRGG